MADPGVDRAEKIVEDREAKAEKPKVPAPKVTPLASTPPAKVKVTS
jgi:hypothetical protein